MVVVLVGAPLIAIVACLGLAVDLCSEASAAELKQIETDKCQDAVMDYIQGKMDYLATSRPTAVNLFNALAELKVAVENAKDEKDPCQKMVNAVMTYAEFMLERDAQDCKNIGKYGADQILKGSNDSNKKVTVMTICNTGSLATSTFGTALGVVRAIHERGMLERVVALETRPYNQGSRLTAYEIVHDKLPGGTLICDSMAAAMMRTQKVDAVVVGADRVCANGDTGNKIGTYNLSVVAAAHGVPVYVASPFTTLDVNLSSGDDMVIEERPANELLTTARAPENIAVWNPAFDVTPAKYISGIITEKGVIQQTADGKLDVAAFVKEHSN